MFIKAVNRFYCAVYQIFDADQCQIERVYRALHSLHKVNGGQATDALLTVRLRKADIDPVPRLSDAKTRKFIEGVGKTPKKIVMLLNAQKMLNDDEIKSLELD